MPVRSSVAAVGVAVAIIAGGSASGRSQKTAPADTLTIVPGVRFGPIRETISRSALPPLLPPNAIRDAEINIGEGFCVSGTLLFPGTSDEAEVTWQDARKSRVASVRIKKPDSRWVTSSGVRIGTLLTDLERISGQLLTFSGLETGDWSGSLRWPEADGSLSLLVRLDPSSSQAAKDAADRSRVFRQSWVRSDDPLIRALRIRVRWITQSWGQHFGEKDCV